MHKPRPSDASVNRTRMSTPRPSDASVDRTRMPKPRPSDPRSDRTGMSAQDASPMHVDRSKLYIEQPLEYQHPCQSTWTTQPLFRHKPVASGGPLELSSFRNFNDSLDDYVTVKIKQNSSLPLNKGINTLATQNREER